MKEKKIAFIALPGRGGSLQVNALKTLPLPPLGRIEPSFIVKRRKTSFQIGIRIGANMHSSFFVGVLVLKASIRRSRHDHDGGLLDYCLE